MEQLHLLFLCDLQARLRPFTANRWADADPSLEVFFTEVEGMEAFQAAMTHEGWRCEVTQSET